MSVEEHRDEICTICLLSASTRYSPSHEADVIDCPSCGIYLLYPDDTIEWLDEKSGQPHPQEEGAA